MPPSMSISKNGRHSLMNITDSKMSDFKETMLIVTTNITPLANDTILTPNLSDAEKLLSNSHNTLLPAWSQFSELEKNLIYGNIVTICLLLLQSICFLIYILRVRSRRRRCKQKMILKRDNTARDTDNTVRYSEQPLKHRSDPEIYESLKDLIDDTPLPPSIDTLPKKTSNKKTLDKDINNTWNTNTVRPRLPLPHEIEAPLLSQKSSEFATMPRTPQLRKPLPHTMQTLPLRQHSPFRAPQPGVNSPNFTRKPIVPPPQLQSPGFRNPGTDMNVSRSPMDYPNRYVLSPTEVVPTPQREQQIQQKNMTLRLQKQINDPDIDNELLEKLKKRAALIPKSEDTPNRQINDDTMSRLPAKLSKPLPPTPRESDYYGWAENFDDFEPLEQINMYNI